MQLGGLEVNSQDRDNDKEIGRVVLKAVCDWDVKFVNKRRESVELNLEDVKRARAIPKAWAKRVSRKTLQIPNCVQRAELYSEESFSSFPQIFAIHRLPGHPLRLPVASQKSQSSVSAAHVLLQSVEAVLPKQKKNVAVKEFKNAMIAHKRRCKAHGVEKVDFDIGALSKKLTTIRGYCRLCGSVVWLNNTKCPNVHFGISDIADIKPVTALQVVEYLQLDSIFLTSSSDSDNDSKGLLSALWAYHI
ncbi:hypothetical protein Fmac_023641 [Flemingia macrophylla]|uniref:F-box protein At5g52880-like ARM repeats region domain-containing protein n=1 Tax=Flemingia macrophylla TaxID=520843 RepID=A0ABD1LM26_9FABA